MESAFNPEEQVQNIDAKLIYGLEKVSQIYRVLLWKTQTDIGLSPIQSQILIFMLFHDEKLVSISNFAIEFSVTKATVSDAFKTLIKKGLVRKEQALTDKRRQILKLTEKGILTAESVKTYTQPLEESMSCLTSKKKEQFFSLLKDLLGELNKRNIISPLRMCITCRYYEKRASKSYCNLMESILNESELRLDCVEYEAG